MESLGAVLDATKLELHHLGALVAWGALRGYSSVGRALPWHGRGQGFNSP